MAATESISKRLTELQSKLTKHAGSSTDPKNADGAVMIEALALLAEGLSKLSRDVREMKKASAGKGKAAGAKAGKPAAAKPGAAAKAGAGKKTAAAKAKQGAKPKAGAAKAGAAKKAAAEPKAD